VHERPVVAPAYQDEEGQGISDDEFRSHLGELNSQASPAVKQFGQALYDEDPDGAPVLTKKYSIEAGYGKLALPHKKTQFVGALKLVMMIDYYYTRAIDLEDEVKEVADPMDISLSIELFGCMFNVKTLHGALLTQSMLIDEHVGMINESKRYGYGRIMLWLPPYAMRALAGIVKPIDSVKDYLEELASVDFRPGNRLVVAAQSLSVACSQPLVGICPDESGGRLVLVGSQLKEQLLFWGKRGV
jgi:hypothetical protein